MFVPVDCIHPAEGDDVDQLYIDPSECIECGACEPECPVEAIFTVEDLPEEWAHFEENKRRLLFGTGVTHESSGLFENDLWVERRV